MSSSTAGRRSVNRAEVVRLYQQGQSMRKIAQAMGVSQTAIHENLRKAGVPSRRPGGSVSVLTPERRKEILAAYRDGETIDSIRVRLGVSDTTIRKAAEEAGEPRRPRGARRTLDWDQIAGLAQQGWPADAIAILIGASEAHIRRILKKVTQEAARDAEEADDGETVPVEG